jgi:hypothetical protein
MRHEFGAVFDAAFALPARARRGHKTRGHGGAATGQRVALQDQHVLARIVGCQRGGQTASACADHQDRHFGVQALLAVATFNHGMGPVVHANGPRCVERCRPKPQAWRSAAPVVRANEVFSEVLRASAKALSIAAPDLLGPASHDAAAFHSAGIPFGFVFIRNPSGRHHPGEDMSTDDFMQATAILTNTLKALNKTGYKSSVAA